MDGTVVAVGTGAAQFSSGMGTGGFALTWHGDAIIRRMDDAVRDATDETTAACVVFARPLARRKTGLLQGGIQNRPAQNIGGGWVGQFGVYGVDYWLFQDRGTRYIEGTFFLERAVAVEFPQLPDRVRARFGG